MVNRIILFSLKNRFLILLGSLLMIVGGLWIGNRMDIDVFPDLTAPTVVIMTDCNGMAPEEIERLVTFPIESAVNGATDVRRVRSASRQGFSFVWVEFDWGTDIFKARQVVSEKMVTLTGVIPENTKPVLAPQSSVMGEILFIGLQSDSLTGMDLRTLGEWVIKPTILATGGVSQVTVIGGDNKEYQILADPVKMGLYGVTLDELAEAVTYASDNSSGNVLRQFGNEYLIRGVARTNDTIELGRTLVKFYNGLPVTLADVADVGIHPGVKMGYASQNGKPAVIISVSKQPGVNTLEVTENIEKNLEGLRKSLPNGVKLDTSIFRQADFIQTSVNNVGRALIEGAIFVIIILFLFLGSFRTTIISVVAIPLSLLGAVIVLDLLGMNINTMTLGGMCIAIGSLVDDAIIDVENVFKRLRENKQLPQESQRNSLDVVLHASSEIRASIINATMIIIVAFIPLFFLSGMEGRMLKPLGVAFIVSLSVSLLVAMTLTPLLCNLLLSSDKYLLKKSKENRFTNWLKVNYTKALALAFRYRLAILSSSAALFVLSLGLYFSMGRSFLPDFNEGSMTIAAVCQPGVSLDQSNQLGILIEKKLLSISEIQTTARRTGRGELDEHSQASNSAEIDANFKLENKTREEFFSEVREKLAEIPGIAVTVGQPLGHRIDHMLSGTRANIAIKIFGPDLNRLFTLGNEVKAAVSDIEGLVDVNVDQQVETPEVQIRANRVMLAAHGITLGEFHRFVRRAFGGEVLASVYEGQRSFDLVLKLHPKYTGKIEEMKEALIDLPDGGKIPLSQVADVVSTSGPNGISRENVQRKIVVAANVSGKDMQGVVDQIKERVAEKVIFPEGYRIEYGGQFESAAKASRVLLLTSILAILIIFILLYQEFKDSFLSLIILLNLPLALIGGVIAIWITSGVVSIPSIIGFITLFGIATRNGILLVSRYQNLREEGKSIKEAVRQGSSDRLNPILMTALTAALALIPLVMQGDKSGNEIQSPMALVVLGGLLSSTLMNMFIIPIVYVIIENRREKSKLKELR